MCIEKVGNCKNKTAKNKKIPKINIVKEQVIDSRPFQITSMMEGVIERGTAKNFLLNVPIAGKTGTTNIIKMHGLLDTHLI